MLQYDTNLERIMGMLMQLAAATVLAIWIHLICLFGNSFFTYLLPLAQIDR